MSAYTGTKTLARTVYGNSNGFETKGDLIKTFNEWKDNVENGGMGVNMNKTKLMISGERQKVTQKAVRWPCGVCGRGIGNN